MPILFLFFLGMAQTSWGAAPVIPASEHAAINLDSLSQWNGKVIQKITIQGLVRTHEYAVRWLTTQTEGDTFDAEIWSHGVRKLYNTQALYDIITEVKPADGDKIELVLKITDKWTLVPDINIQGSQSALFWQVGAFDNNLLGNFTIISIVYGQFNGLANYDLNVSQEWILNTDYMASIDISQYTNTPLDAAGWTRTQQELLIGRRFPPKIRLFAPIDFYQDTGLETFSGQQWAISPTFILGRSNLTNYLEEGYEWTVATNIVNPQTTDKNYAALKTGLKLTKVVGGKSNFALYSAVGGTLAPLRSYQYYLGGYNTVRGYGTYRLIGPSFGVLNLEYRPYLWSYRSALPFLDWVVFQGCVFTDWGAVLGKGVLQTLGSVGVGLRMNFVKYAGSILRFDYAQTLSPNEGTGFSFSIGQFF